jgi:hypothetical protein
MNVSDIIYCSANLDWLAELMNQAVIYSSKTVSFLRSFHFPHAFPLKCPRESNTSPASRSYQISTQYGHAEFGCLARFLLCLPPAPVHLGFWKAVGWNRDRAEPCTVDQNPVLRREWLWGDHMLRVPSLAETWRAHLLHCFSRPGETGPWIRLLNISRSWLMCISLCEQNQKQLLPQQRYG